MNVRTLIVLGAPPLLADLLTRAVAATADVRLVVEPGPADEQAVLRALQSEPRATVVTVGADGRSATVWLLTSAPLEPVSIDALLAAARG